MPWWVMNRHRGDHGIASFVRGRLINDKKEPIAGATIAVKGNKSTITTTSDNGEFGIRVAEGDTSLVVTSINYEPKEIRLTGEKELVIQLRKGSASSSMSS